MQGRHGEKEKKGLTGKDRNDENGLTGK